MKFNSIVWIALLTTCFLLPIAANQAAERPNIVLVLADDLGYGDLHCYGEKDIADAQPRSLRHRGTAADKLLCGPSQLLALAHGADDRPHAHARRRAELDPGRLADAPAAERDHGRRAAEERPAMRPATSASGT